MLEAIRSWWRGRTLAKRFQGAPVITIGASAREVFQQLQPAAAMAYGRGGGLFESYSWETTKHKIEIRVWKGDIHQVRYKLMRYGQEDIDRVQVAAELMRQYGDGMQWLLKPKAEKTARWEMSDGSLCAEADGRFVELAFGSRQFEHELEGRG